MPIHGLQKLTLLDFPGRIACTVFLAGCPFRCPYCHNSDLLAPEAEPFMSDEELAGFLKKRKGLLDGVAVTGGEPLMHEEIFDLLRMFRELGYPVKLDTNGAYPERLKKIVEEGLADYIAMDVKNSPERYPATVGLDAYPIDRIDESIRFLLGARVDYEFRTTVVDEFHDEDSFVGIGNWIRGAKRYFLQPFTDRDTVLTQGLTPPSESKLISYLSVMKPFVQAAEIRGVDLNKKTDVFS